MNNKEKIYSKIRVSECFEYIAIRKPFLPFRVDDMHQIFKVPPAYNGTALSIKLCRCILARYRLALVCIKDLHSKHTLQAVFFHTLFLYKRAMANIL